MLKKFLIFLTVFVLLFSFTVPAFAADAGGGENSGVIEGGTTTDEETPTWLQGFLNGIGNVVSSLFVPSDDFLEGIVNRFKEKVPFVYVVINFVDEFYNFLFNTDFTVVPELNFSMDVLHNGQADFGIADSKYNWGTATFNVLDLSWYLGFKPYVDTFLSAFLWLGYLWLLYKRIPDIINGAGMVTAGGLAYTQTESREAARNAEKEYRNSYEAYAERRERNEAYSERYKGEHNK